MKQVHYTLDALKQLKKHSNMRDRIMRVVDEYAADDKAHATQVKPLAGSTAKRLRVGAFRVVFEETAAEIIVTKIGPRGGVYE